MILKFIKLANKWFVHLPNYIGSVEALEMVMGADTLCEKLDKDKDGIVIIKVSEFLTDMGIYGEYDYVLDLVECTNPGATYTASSHDMYDSFEIWLCEVTLFVLGEYPKVLYIKNLNN